MSPAMHPSKRHLTPHSPYTMDARRNSDVSSLSLTSSFTNYSSDFSMPPTPICGRSPLTTESFDPSAFDMGPTQSINRLPMDYPQKTSSFDEPWTSLDAACHMTQTLPVRNFETFASHGNYVQSHIPAYVGMEATTPVPWCTPASTTYSTYDNHLNMNGLDMDPNASLQSMWNLQIPQMQGMATSTIVPHEALLDGEYVCVDTPDISMEPYDDMDVPLPSPREVVFKAESSPGWVKTEQDSSDDDSRLRRSIHETRTGGKSIKKERRGGSVCKRKTKAKQPQFIARWADGRRECREGCLERDPDTKKYRWADQQPRKKFLCQYPYEDDDDNIPEDRSKICGKLFQRPEHRQRHRKTHCSDKDFPCLLCDKNFNRNDNCWAHGFTHVHRPGKKDGRNAKFSLRQVISVLTDPKHIDKLLNDWKKEVGSEYIPEDDEDDNAAFMTAVSQWNPDHTFRYDAEEAVEKIRNHRM